MLTTQQVQYTKKITMFLILFVIISLMSLSKGDVGCKDEIPQQCPKYHSDGWCLTNPWVKANCKMSCGDCTPSTPSTCNDGINKDVCRNYKKKGYCSTNSWVRNKCKKTCQYCGTTQTTARSKTNRPIPGNCGTSNMQGGRVIAGQTSKAGQWPWQVALVENGVFTCGGSLIASNWVVTAVHCLKGTNVRQLKVILGDLHRSQNSGNEQTISVSKIIKHQWYGNNDYDIALLKLSKPAMLNNHVQTVCLPNQGQHISVGSECYITGWGKTQNFGRSVPELQHAKLSVIANSECSRSNSNIARVTKTMVCAKKRYSKQSACHGDSGGPFVCRKNDGSWALHGVISWGSPQCDVDDAVSVFARISEFRNWIDDKMGRY